MRFTLGQQFAQSVITRIEHTHDAPSGRKMHTVHLQCVCGYTYTLIEKNVGVTNQPCRACRKKEDRLYKHPLRSTWFSMHYRCTKPDHPEYVRYGARGIRVCQRWTSATGAEKDTSGFLAFEADVGKRPSGKTLDRIDPDGDYTPENVRWATLSEQQHNRRDALWLTVDGVSKPFSVWSKETGTPHTTMRGRVKLGYTGREVLYGRKPK